MGIMFSKKIKDPELAEFKRKFDEQSKHRKELHKKAIQQSADAVKDAKRILAKMEKTMANQDNSYLQYLPQKPKA